MGKVVVRPGLETQRNSKEAELEVTEKKRKPERPDGLDMSRGGIRNREKVTEVGSARQETEKKTKEESCGGRERGH